jgi:hypothetical protein
MGIFVWLALASLALSLTLPPLFRNVFQAYGIVDEPDQNRKIHGQLIPRGGRDGDRRVLRNRFFLVVWKTGAVPAAAW